MSYLFLVLALLSSFSIALLLKVFQQKERNSIVIVASNYIVAGALGYLLSQKMQVTTSILAFSIVVGFFFCLGFTLLFLAVKKKGIASSVTIGRLSLAIPVALSISLWGEKPLLVDIIGLLVIFFIILNWEGKIGNVSPILMSIFVVFGLLDSAMKFFKLEFPFIDDSFFLVFVFCSAMVWSWLYILVSRQKPKQADIFWGLFLGVPNFFSSFFLLKALASIPAYVVFPFINIGIIILSALGGHLLFKEKLDRKKVVLILLGIIAVFFLSS
jgi:drug/metabolite transporter (DMT)-like permease